METRREASAYALPLHSVVHLEVSQVSGDGRFAALINCHAIRRGEAVTDNIRIIPKLMMKVKFRRKKAKTSPEGGAPLPRRSITKAY